VKHHIIGEMHIITDIFEVVRVGFFKNTRTHTSDGTDVTSPPQTVCSNPMSVVVMVS